MLHWESPGPEAEAGLAQGPEYRVERIVARESVTEYRPGRGGRKLGGRATGCSDQNTPIKLNVSLECSPARRQVQHAAAGLCVAEGDRTVHNRQVIVVVWSLGFPT